MKRDSAVARVRKAQVELAVAESELAKAALPWRWRFRRHRSAVAIFGGFTSGLALALLPTRWWGRIGAVVGATAAGAARSLITPAVIGAMLSQLRHENDAATRPAPTTATDERLH